MKVLAPMTSFNYIDIFIAGMFDGDGSFSIKNHTLRANLISTKECLESIQNILLKQDIAKTKIYQHYTTYRFHLYKDTLKFLKYIYDDNFSYLYLSRKYIKYKNYEPKQKKNLL